MSRGIEICGIGAVTGYGWGREILWDGLVSGKPAAVLTGGFGRNRDESVWIATVPEGGDPADGRGRFARAMRASAREAIEDAKGRGWTPGRRVGLLHAVVIGEAYLWKDFYVTDKGKLRLRDYLALMPSTPMSTFMQEYGFHGPAMNVSAMCASGNAGLLTAKAWLDAGIVDDVVLVATDLSLTPENVLHFTRLGVAVANREPLDGCRPFQEGSRGFVMGEASVGMVLSNRSDRPYAVTLGGAMSHDAYHVTSIDPAFPEVRRCFVEALDNARVPAEEVRYVNAHGPGTKQCDKVEAAILEELFRPDTGIYSVKPLAGHCQGAASAVEVAVAALGYERGVIPAPPCVAEAHPQLLHGEFGVDGGLTVKSSLGMGGHNSVVVLGPARA
ncbi:beta-ketoacyl synthase N-terminal-like domain-containing protein [Prauserella flavalba]|uniref:3-oxoacyl-ACP synthase n=1 Tax=Prauserella flavalba TaxID=1477506 RepID=A0A318LFV7_9PSEU|nr:beta-ketoacyl synthase N-terminal-like domain-containing protein [Prauserella flavalba]PXY26275.1 3-oxoacyl-ACP synthase [Prauserella flavalba]